jgi:predicted metal-dependent phosphoesterase TrpH
MKKHPDKFSSVNQVFDELIGTGKKAFVKTSDRVSIEDGIKVIKNAGGISILAHPGIYPTGDSIKIIDYFVERGGDGIEVYYPYHIVCPKQNLDEHGNNNKINFYRDIAKSKKILESGGNDHHDEGRSTMGVVKVPYTVLENLKKRVPVS